MPVKFRQLISQGSNAFDGSSWDVHQARANLDGVASGLTIPVLAIGPRNLAAPQGVSSDDFGGAALTAATTTKGIGVLNAPVAVLGGAWLFYLVAGAGASTVQLQVVSTGPGTNTPVVSNISAAVASSAQLRGWNSVTLAPNAERQPVINGTAQADAVALYPGDIIQAVTAGGVIVPAGTLLVLDVA